MKICKIIANVLCVVGLCLATGKTAQAANITLLDRNPVLFDGYLDEHDKRKGLGAYPPSYLDCIALDCEGAKTQKDLDRLKRALVEGMDWLFKDGLSLDGAWSYEETHDLAALTSLIYSRVILISGVIEPGDTERLKTFVLENDLMDCLEPGYCPFNTVISLDSPGGSLVEGLKLANYVKAHSFVTFLGKGARCESACSMVFLNGYTTFEGFFHKRRFAHETARLGLHRPHLTVPPRSYSAEDVNKVQEIINISLNSVVELFADAHINLLILSNMYSAAPENMYYLSVPELELIGRVLYQAGQGRQPMTRADALKFCSEDYNARFGRYEDQLLRHLASADDVFITYVEHSDYACYGMKMSGVWHYDICKPYEKDYRNPTALCRVAQCAADLDGKMSRCNGKYTDQNKIDIFNFWLVGDALREMRNSHMLQLVRDAMQSESEVHFDARPIPVWVKSAQVPTSYCGSVDMRAPSNLKRLQVALNANGFSVGTPDGSIGPKTLGQIGNANARYLGTESQWVEPELLQALGVPQNQIPNFLICQK